MSTHCDFCGDEIGPGEGLHFQFNPLFGKAHDSRLCERDCLVQFLESNNVPHALRRHLLTLADEGRAA